MIPSGDRGARDKPSFAQQSRHHHKKKLAVLARLCFLSKKTHLWGCARNKLAGSTKEFRWGIWGTGDISWKFAVGLRQMSFASPAWVLSREQARASEFAKRIGAENGFADPARAFEAGADAVYIGTPAHLHAEHAVRALEAGLPVLVEKPFATTLKDATLIAAAAQRSGKFAMEAMWTRFQPAIGAVRRLLSEGAVGTPRLMRAEFCVATLPSGSSHHPEGGGALRQRGVYALSLASHLFGFPEESSAVVRRAPSGVDEDVMVQLRHPEGTLTQFSASLSTTASNTLEILGDRGALRFDGPIWRPFGLRLVSFAPRRRGEGGGRLAAFRESALGQSMHRTLMPLMARRGRRIPSPPIGNGYGHQADEVMARILAGELESLLMPISESVALTALMEELLDKGRQG
jgi:predicted dehydrogenase